MESLLRDSRLPEVEAPDFSGKVLFYPVRHHSPVCSFQLERTIAAYQPDCILIEGPENASDLIPVLTDDYTRLPAAIYYFYKDKKKLVSDEAEDYHCYYPFLESSPEYTAMTEAKRLGIPAKFIDLPYSEILIHTKDFAGLRKAQERHSYADDHYLTQSRFYEKLCEKTNLRSFEEFWEKYFEIAGLRLSPQDFIRQMYTYCALTREGTPPELMENDGTLAREQHMAFRIREAMETYRKILVVTGGFHSPALAELIQKEVKAARLHSFSPEQQSCYPIAYSFEAADALNGYASGMPHAGFYTEIMRTLRSGELSAPEEAYRKQALTLLTDTAKESSRKDIALSISDAISAYSLAEGLAALRESPVPGFGEVWDGVTAAFIKGEKTAASSLPLDVLTKLATGNDIGHIGDKSHVPPLIQDFEKQCRLFRIKAETVVPQEIDISLFTSERELEKSRFFHRMEFLGTGFCKMKKGPDLHANRDRSRVREVWSYCRTPGVDAMLVDLTTEGTTLAEACRSIASKSLRTQRRVEVAAQVSVDCFLTGVALAEEDVRLMEEILANDGDFFSLGNGLHYFDMLRELRTLYGFDDPANQRYLTRCFTKLLALLPSMGGVQPEQAADCIRICRLLYGITGRLLSDRRDELKQALISLLQREQKEPSVHGAALGLLYAMDGSFLESAELAMQGYLKGSPTLRKQGALYLRGLFETARDIALSGKRFLEMTDELLGGMDYDDFMEILPPMRLAFSYFTPQETQQIAAEAAALHGMKEKDVLDEKALDEALAAFGAELDAEIFRILREGETV